MKWKYSLIYVLVLSVSLLVKPYKVTGEVKNIEEADEQLQGISIEEIGRASCRERV